MTDPCATGMEAKAEAATAFLKVLGHAARLMVLSHLTTGEKSVGALEEILDSRQAAVHHSWPGCDSRSW